MKAYRRTYFLWGIIAFVFFISSCATVSYRRTSLNLSRYYRLDEFCKEYGFSYKPDFASDIIRLSALDKEIKLLLHSSLVSVNGNIFYLKNPILYQRGIVYLPREIAHFLKARKSYLYRVPVSLKTIVIDPGHGGKDPGAISPSGIKEKNINLKIARYLRQYLKNKGFEVILTRNRDIYLTLKERVLIAKKYNADLFISIHSNSNPSRYLRGAEVYYLNPTHFHPQRRALSLAQGRSGVEKDKKAIIWDMLFKKNYSYSRECARYLFRSFRSLGLKIFSPKHANFYVLRNAYVPAVLVEVGYLTNKYEARMLNSHYYQKQIASAIALGIVSMNKSYLKFAREQLNE